MIFVLSRSVLIVTVLVLAQAGAPIPIQQHIALESPNDIVQPDSAMQSKIAENYGKLPLTFEANHGQTDAQVKFLSRGSGYTLFLTGDEAVFSFSGNNARHDTPLTSRQSRPILATPATSAVLRMKLVKANHAAEPNGEDALPGKTNYFVGNDSQQWHSNVPTYTKVK